MVPGEGKNPRGHISWFTVRGYGELFIVYN